MSQKKSLCPVVSSDLSPSELTALLPAGGPRPTTNLPTSTTQTVSPYGGSPCQSLVDSAADQKQEPQKDNVNSTCELCSKAETKDLKRQDFEDDTVTKVASVAQAIAFSTQKVARRDVYELEIVEEFLTMEQIFNRILSSRPRRRLQVVQKAFHKRQYIDQSSLGSVLLRASRGFVPAPCGIVSRK